MNKPALFITPAVIEERGICNEYIDSLKKWFNVRTISKKEISREHLLANVRGVFAILCSASEPMNEEVVKAAGSTLKVISQPAAGYNNIDQKVMKEHSIRIGIAGNAITAAAAEMAVANLLAACRHVVKFANDYKKNPKTYYQPKCPAAVGLQNSIIGIVGAGKVGSSIARKLMQFDIKKFMYFCKEEKPDLNALGGEMATLENIAKYCDYLIVSLSYNETTHQIISKNIIDLMKPTALLVNIGRGGLIDQDYLVEVLKDKKIAGAALDVTVPEPLPPNHPLLILDNVVITPHVGGLTTVANEKSTKLAVENIIAVLNNTSMPQELKL